MFLCFEWFAAFAMAEEDIADAKKFDIENADEDVTDSAKSSSVVVTDAFIASDYYNVSHPNRGFALIFNHYIYDDKNMNPRQGTEKDVKNLKSTFGDLGFDVQVYNDLRYGDMYDVLQTVSEFDHSNHSCLVVVVMSHGESGVIHARDCTYRPEILWSPFTGDKCATLAGKPKLFFIQACRGEEVDSGVKISSRSAFVQADASPVSSYTIPAMADILVMYSTYDGYYSWRNPTLGSWFIESLCKELNKHAKSRDLVTILTFVNRRMATQYQSNVPSNYNMHQKKQIGTIVSTFTRMLHFYLD